MALLKSDDSKEEHNKFYHEPLFVGNLCQKSNSTKHFYRWITFISCSKTEIKAPETVKCVEYKFKNNSCVVTTPPFFYEASTMAIFQFAVIITFKSKFIRTQFEVPCILCLSHPTSLSAIDSDGNIGSKQYFDHLFDYTKFEKYKNEKNKVEKASFVRAIGHTLKKNIQNVPTPVKFVGFSMRMNDFKPMMKEILSSNQILNALNINDSILHVIGFYVLFDAAMPICDLLQNQRCVVRDCKDCDITISSMKFNHLMIRNCHNMSITFPHIITQCELSKCSNISIKCSDTLHHYRFDDCANVKVQINDFGKRVTFLCFECENIELSVQQRKEVYDVGASKGKRWNVRWRSNVNEAVFTQRQFSPSQTIGRLNNN